MKVTCSVVEHSVEDGSKTFSAVFTFPDECLPCEEKDVVFHIESNDVPFRFLKLEATKLSQQVREEANKRNIGEIEGLLSP